MAKCIGKMNMASRLLYRILRMPTIAGLSARHALPAVVHTGLRCLQASSRKAYYGSGSMYPSEYL